MSQFSLDLNEAEINRSQFLNLKEASLWATRYLNQNVTTSNISYLIQYGRLKRYGESGKPLIKTNDLKSYYDSCNKEKQWKEKLGKDLNWKLSFDEYKESERTKHIHRLHPYKGKFIPQLVEYFLSSHTDEFKKRPYFQKGDIILDPFCGSGTTLVQSNELGMHSIGTDISAFNAMISNVKVSKHNVLQLKEAISKLTLSLENFQKTKSHDLFDKRLLEEVAKFNLKQFPSPEYKRKIHIGEINEKEYSKGKEKEFLSIYHDLLKEYKIEVKQRTDGSFIGKWFLLPVKEEIDFIFNEMKNTDNEEIKKVLTIILSRVVRSCRATTHADLGTLKEPTVSPYYCKKHGKICKPLFTLKGWWKRYTKDTLNRIVEFDKFRTKTFQACLAGDSKTIDLYKELEDKNPEFVSLLQKQKIKGIFSSPPYVGLIDYHEQHAYSYELFGFERKDELEIGPLVKGQGLDARNSYVKGISEVLKNMKKYLHKDYNIFLVANDKFNLYHRIAELAQMKVVQQFERPVLNRVEKDRSNAYSETIFHLRKE